MTGWGTPAEIAIYVGRPVRTIRNWAASGVIPSARHPETGALIVHAAATRRHANTRQIRKRLLTPSS